MLLFAAVALLFVSSVQGELGSCLEAASGLSSVPCTANDIVIAKVELELPPTDSNGNLLPSVGGQSICSTPGVTPPAYCSYTCQAGQLIKISLGATFLANAFTRYDMGVWIGTMGYDAKTTTTANACEKYYLYPNPALGNPLDVVDGYGQWQDFDGDMCGDVLKGELTHMILQDRDGTDNVLMVNCTDLINSASTGVLQISTCLSWDNNAMSTCTSAAQAIPGTGAKCRCEPIAVTQILLPAKLDLNVTGPSCFTTGDVLTFNITMRNVLQGVLSNITYTSMVVGSHAMPLAYPNVTGCPTSLAGGASAMCSVSFIAPAESYITLTVTASGTSQGGAVIVGATASTSAGNPTVLNQLSSFANPECVLACDGSISVATSGALPLTYEWSSGATTPTVTNLCPATYVLTASDAFGCEVNRTFVLTATNPCGTE